MFYQVIKYRVTWTACLANAAVHVTEPLTLSTKAEAVEAWGVCCTGRQSSQVAAGAGAGRQLLRDWAACSLMLRGASSSEAGRCGWAIQGNKA